jgi:HK97 family phage prohead protease
MIKKVFNLTSSLKQVDREDDGSLYIEGMASTSDPDRIGDIVKADAWKEDGLTDYQKNPIILFNHNYDRPIGRATELSITNSGLRMKAKISKAAGEICNLIEEGVLNAFSVGFLVEDAVYNEKTGGLTITKAKLIENSVVSVPMNQDAIFSVSKSFDTEEEYRDYVNQFRKSGLDMETTCSDELKVTDNTTPEPAAVSAKEEKGKMDPNNFDIDEVAAKAAEKAAAKIAMKQAEEKAVEEKARAQKELDEKLAQLEIGKTGAEKLAEELKAELAKKDAEIAETLEKYKADLEEKSKELEDMRASKAMFVDRSNGMSVKEWAKKNADDLVGAHILALYANKRIDETDFGKQLFEKAGINYTAEAPDLDQEIQDRILKEVMVMTKVAGLFREVPVNGAATIMPFQSDTGLAEWAADATAGNLENRPQVTANQYNAKQVVMNAYRLVSSSFINNDTDEQVLVNLMPMLVEGVARAHARTVESQLLNGAANPFDGLDTLAAASGRATAVSAASPGTLTALDLLKMRGEMGKFGLSADDIAYIVNLQEYYSLVEDPQWADVNLVGSDAVKLRGQVGSVYGSPVIVSDEFPAVAQGAPMAFAVNRNNYLIPRLRGVTVEQDYEVMNQRRVIVASQALGFTEIQAGDGSTFEPVVKHDYAA